MFFLPVVQAQDGKWRRGELTKVRDLAQAWAMHNGYEINARDAVVLYGETEEKVESVWRNLTTGNLDEKREKLEMGACCGDHDQPYQMGLPNSGGGWREWAQMVASVQAGELGGEFDGAERGAA